MLYRYKAHAKYSLPNLSASCPQPDPLLASSTSQLTNKILGKIVASD